METYHPANGLGKDIHEIWLPVCSFRPVEENARALIDNDERKVKRGPDFIAMSRLKTHAKALMDS
jgi:hypothetical protein